MYWIYLIIFTFIVFIPSIVEKGFLGLSIIQTQEYSILLLGILAFIIFNYKERRYKKNLQEKTKMMSQVSRMSKELTHSYSYIGEINRKLDLLENVTAGFPETSELPIGKKMEIYDSIMHAIHMLSRSDDFALRFIDERKGEILKEIRSKEKKNDSLSIQECTKGTFFFETEKFIFVRSVKSIDNIYACIVMRKKSSSHRTDDPEILKTLAMHALFLFMFIQEKSTHSEHHIDKKN